MNNILLHQHLGSLCQSVWSKLLHLWPWKGEMTSLAKPNGSRERKSWEIEKFETNQEDCSCLRTPPPLFLHLPHGNKKIGLAGILRGASSQFILSWSYCHACGLLRIRRQIQAHCKAVLIEKCPWSSSKSNYTPWYLLLETQKASKFPNSKCRLC